MYTAVVFLPLLGAIVAGLFGRRIGDGGAQLITCSMMVASAILSAMIFVAVALEGGTTTVTLLRWIDSGDLRFWWALRYDTLTAVMMVVVSWVSCAVHIYSVGYMQNDPSISRFQSYLSLFTFFMMMLVTADNLVQMFFGWEGVGLASYLLIGFWYDRPAANAAAIKAFVVNRVGDFGFMLGLAGIFFVFNSVTLTDIFAAAPSKAATVIHVFGMDVHAMTALCLLLFVGAMGKSAQLGLHVWLPDAMEGPTPVSALIHAATMVTAGVFMVARMSPLFELSDTALIVVTLVGAFTAFFAATVGCVQNDIKRIIAYSTCSQLGYMFFALGVSAYQAAIFHLMTHAFFKALLFLGAGAVIHAMSDEQDIRKMGGIWRHILPTYVLMIIGSWALAGIWPFAGFYSKDAILEAAWAAHTPVGQFAYWIGIAVAFLTAFYSWRLLFLVFHGKPRADEHVMAHIHEAPLPMFLPMVFLALGAMGAGYLGAYLFVGDGMDGFWRKAIEVDYAAHPAMQHLHYVPEWARLLPLGVALAGVVFAFVMYVFVPGLPGRLARTFAAPYDFMLNKWYFDEFYDAVFVRPAKVLGRSFWKGGDKVMIDGLGPDGIAATTREMARLAGRLQSGYLYQYAFAMLIGVAVFVTWYMFSIG